MMVQNTFNLDFINDDSDNFTYVIKILNQSIGQTKYRTNKVLREQSRQGRICYVVVLL